MKPETHEIQPLISNIHSTSVPKFPASVSEPVFKKPIPSKPMERRKIGSLVFSKLEKSVSKTEILVPSPHHKSDSGDMNSGSVTVGSELRKELLKTRFADLIAKSQKQKRGNTTVFESEIPLDHETTRRNNLVKEREAARNALEKMVQTVHFDDGLGIERDFMMLLGSFNYNRAKEKLVKEDMEEGEIRLPTLSCSILTGSNGTMQQENEVSERKKLKRERKNTEDVKIIEIKRAFRGSVHQETEISQVKMLWKEREKARNGTQEDDLEEGEIR